MPLREESTIADLAKALEDNGVILTKVEKIKDQWYVTGATLEMMLPAISVQRTLYKAINNCISQCV